MPKWLRIYTAAFLLVASVAVAALTITGKTLVWWPDGVKQHYTVLGYLGQTLRGLLQGRGFRMMDLTLGQGLDIMTTATYYGYTDPLSLLAVFASGDGLEIAYAVIEFLRLYLTGFFFCLYAMTIELKDDYAISSAALIFVFCGYYMAMLVRHPYFINGGLYMLLLLMGVERLFKYGKWHLYVFSAALMLIVNFYFAYINTIGTVIYILIRLLARWPQRRLRGTTEDGFSLLGGYVLGAMISAVVLLPVIIVYLDNARYGVHGGYAGPLSHYGLDYYKELLTDLFVVSENPGAYAMLGFMPPALLGLMALFAAQGKREKQLCAAILLCMIGICVPFFGKLMNGLSYVTNRWSYLLALFVALGCACGFQALLERSRRSVVVAYLAMLYAVLSGVWFIMRERKFATVSSLIIFLTALLVLYCARKGSDAKREKLLQRGVAVLVTGSCMVYMAISYLPQGYGALKENMGRGIPAQIESPAVEALRGEEGIYRIDRGFYDDPYALLQGYRGTSFYWSLVSGTLGEYYRELYLSGQPAADVVSGLGGGSALHAVSSVKWFIREGERPYVVPYGFEEKMTGDGWTVYENQYALPLGYTFRKTMSEETFASLDIVDRLQAILDCAILEDGAVEDVEVLHDSHRWDIPFQVEDEDAVVWEGNRVSARAGGRVRISFEAQKDREIFLIWKGLSADAGHDLYFTVAGEAGATDVLVFNREASNFWYPREGCAVCLGTGDMDACEITFWWDEQCSWEDLRLVALPLETYRENVNARRSESLREVEAGNDIVSGRISVSERSVMQLSIPYSAGWQAEVDGHNCEVFRCGGMYMGVWLDPGEHEIVFRYRTPGLAEGAVISLSGLITAGILTVKERKKRRKTKA